MQVLFIHRSFPGQFRYVAPLLAKRYGWRCTFLTADTRIPSPAEVVKVNYRPAEDPLPELPIAGAVAGPMAHALGVYQALKARRDIQPDLIVSHGSYGSTLFLPHLHDAPIINFFEYFYRAVGQDLGYRPDVPVSERHLLDYRARNAMTLLDLDNCDTAWTPTNHQRTLMPREYHEKIDVVHDGIDTEAFRRMLGVPRRLPDGTEVPAGTRIVTYASRGFEMLRGFDVFMKMARRVYQQYPDVLFVVAGRDEVFYGSQKQRGGHRSFRERVLAEGDYDLSKFRFVGKLPQAGLARVLALSDLHVYLTVPFFTSWSPLEAMASGCVVLGSDTPCVREYLQDDHNGLLCDFFDEDGMARRAVEVLRDPAAHRPLGEAARRTIEKTYSIDATLPRIKAMFERVASTPREPSVRAELLCGAGVPPAACAPAVRPPPAVQEQQAGRLHHIDLPPYDGSIPFRVDSMDAPLKGPKAGGAQVRESQHPPLVVPAPVDLELSSFAFGAAPVVKWPRRADRPRTVLFAWELGAGLGHLMQMRALAEGLARLGYRVIVCLREIDRAGAVFRHPGIRVVQAPICSGCAARYARPRNYAEMLCNVGFGSDGVLSTRAGAWRELLVTYAPDLLVVDHSPTALLAARGLGMRVALLGSGFCCPPDSAHAAEWGSIRTGGDEDGEDAPQKAGEELLARTNRILDQWRAPRLDRLGALYSDPDVNFLCTFPELDHFPSRPGAEYWGPTVGEAPVGASGAEWPAGGRPRAFVYLKRSPETAHVLAALRELALPTLAYVDDASRVLRRRLESPIVRVADAPLDVPRVVRECDLAILNGGHGVTAEVLLAGKPLLFVPLAHEQRMTADAVGRLGAGRSCSARSADEVRAALEALLTGGCGAAAGRFADRYAAFDPRRQREAMCRRAQELLGQSTDDLSGMQATVRRATANEASPPAVGRAGPSSFADGSPLPATTSSC